MNPKIGPEFEVKVTTAKKEGFKATITCKPGFVKGKGAKIEITPCSAPKTAFKIIGSCVPEKSEEIKKQIVLPALPKFLPAAKTQLETSLKNTLKPTPHSVTITQAARVRVLRRRLAALLATTVDIVFNRVKKPKDDKKPPPPRLLVEGLELAKMLDTALQAVNTDFKLPANYIPAVKTTITVKVNPAANTVALGTIVAIFIPLLAFMF